MTGPLWQRIIEGDDGAFAEVFDQHADRVYRHARRLVSTQADAEDVTAMVFFEAWRSRKRVRLVGESPLAWLLVTATNLARNVERGRMRYERSLRGLRPDETTDHADATNERFDSDRMRAPVHEAFFELSRKDQEILMLCILEEVPPREVAALMKVPAGTVRMRLSRAKQRLRQVLEVRHPGALNDWLGVN